MKLTDADRAAIKSVLREKRFTQVMAMDAQLYVAGKRAGREDMRERAVKACEGEHVIAAGTGDPARYAYNSATEHCAAAIRALGVDDD